jgi:hypothetical protein
MNKGLIIGIICLTIVSIIAVVVVVIRMLNKPSPTTRSPSSSSKPDSSLSVVVDNGGCTSYFLGDTITAKNLITFSCSCSQVYNECLQGKITAYVTCAGYNGIWLYYSVDGTLPSSGQVFTIFTNNDSNTFAFDFTYKPTQNLKVYFNNSQNKDDPFSVKLVPS